MSATAKILYIKNSQYLELVGLKDQSTSPATYLNAATVTVTLKDPNGVSVPGCTNVAGVYQAASSGTYRCPTDPTLFNPPLGSGYTLVVTAVSGAIQFEAELPIKVAVRQTGLEISS